MTYNLIANLQYCKDIVQEMLPLLLYTHVPSAVISILIGAYVLYKTRAQTGLILFGLACIFSLWTALNLLIWITYDQNTTMVAIWSIFGILSALLFFLTHWFTHAFVTEKSLPFWMAVAWTVAILPVLVLTPTLFNLSGVDIRECVADENSIFTDYYYALGGFAVVLILISGCIGYRVKNAQTSWAPKWLVIVGSLLFVTAFLITGALASYLVDSGLIPDFGLEQYGVATMTVFMGILAYATVRYHAFNLKLLAAQALVISLILLIAAEFLFVTTRTNKILVGVTLGLAAIFGLLLVQSVKREVRQRELIEKQEQELEVVNKQQENLLHFISHEVKGYLAESQAGFASIAEGDYGSVSPQLKQMAEKALAGVRKGVATVMDILNASNLKSGKVSYAKKRFDFKAAVERIVNEQRLAADVKRVTLKAELAEGDYAIEGDEEKLREQVIRNLIDNAVKYTPAGEIKVELSDGDGKIRLSVKDSGVGITQGDMARLFTEGGHGKDSISLNVHSTGYGLFIAKQVVEAHGGKIWAESEGGGKGARFVVELPAA